jgi:hypothetical protein
MRVVAASVDPVTTPLWPYSQLSDQGGSMARLIHCECGFIARGESDDQVIAVISGHIATDHPALLESVKRDDLLSWIQVE